MGCWSIKVGGLYFFVEGRDDAQFVESIIQPFLLKRYDWFATSRYADKSIQYVIRLLRNVPKMEADYIFFADLNGSPSAENKTEKLAVSYHGLDVKKIVIVCPEIEAWYLAGVDSETAKEFGIKVERTTNSLTKEQFEAKKPRSALSRLDFMQSILPIYSIEEAKSKNHSFAAFAEKYELR